MEARYQHTQSAPLVMGMLMTSSIALIGAALLLPDHPASTIGRIVATAVALVLGACAAVFGRMTISVDREQLRWCFGFGLLGKAVPIDTIDHVEPTRLLEDTGLCRTSISISRSSVGSVGSRRSGRLEIRNGFTRRQKAMSTPLLSSVMGVGRLDDHRPGREEPSTAAGSGQRRLGGP